MTADELEERLQLLKGELQTTEEAITAIEGREEEGALHEMERHVLAVEQEMDDIQTRMPKKPRHQRTRPRLPVHLRMRKKKPEEDHPLHQSPNTVKRIIELQRRCEERLGGEEVKMVWALVFKMPEQSTPVDGAEEEEPEDELEEETNLREETLGYDLDGDGDVGQIGERDAQTMSGQLRISHEAWVACERIAESDLVLRHVIPIDQRFLVRGDAAPPLRPLSCVPRCLLLRAALPAAARLGFCQRGAEPQRSN